MRGLSFMGMLGISFAVFVNVSYFTKRNDVAVAARVRCYTSFPISCISPFPPFHARVPARGTPAPLSIPTLTVLISLPLLTPSLTRQSQTCRAAVTATTEGRAPFL